VALFSGSNWFELLQVLEAEESFPSVEDIGGEIYYLQS
jgi:hypothetical protein